MHSRLLNISIPQHLGPCLNCLNLNNSYSYSSAGRKYRCSCSTSPQRTAASSHTAPVSAVWSSASKIFIRRFVITEKAPTMALSWLKAATTAFTFKTLLRHYAKWALTPRSLNVKLGPRHNYHEGHYANQPARPFLTFVLRTQ